MSWKLPYALAALCLYAAVWGIYSPVVSGQPYAYDEADYMWAGKQGFWANYTDQHGLNFVEFVRKGLELSRDSGKRMSFSQFIRSTGDIGLYRHYHGPMYAYWLSLWQGMGTVRENVFRGSGLLIHFASATLILFGFWAVFPSLPRPAALLACALFLFSRTTLAAATIITQHVMFTFFCIAALFASSLFFRSFEARWFYVTLATIGAAFCAVETGVLLIAALLLAMAIEHKRVRAKYPSWKSLIMLFLKGAGAFLLAVLILWPKGILQFALAKGFLTLAYMSLNRRTFSPFGPLDLWRAKFVASPWEYSLFVIGVIAAFYLWRRFANKSELLPWLAFIAIFLLVTLKVTLPYTYYYASIAAAFAVATAVAGGMLWASPSHSRFLVAGAVLISVMGTTWQWRGIMQQAHDAQTCEAAMLRRIGNVPVPAGRQLYIPFQLVPTLHYYKPELETVGYDVGYPISWLTAGTTSPEAADFMFCEQVVCTALAEKLPGFKAHEELLSSTGPTGQLFYVVQVPKDLRGLQPL